MDNLTEQFLYIDTCGFQHLNLPVSRPKGSPDYHFIFVTEGK